jgi:hypothetical protein
MLVMDVQNETILEKTFQFTPDDLKQNRQGQLSASQADRLRRSAGRTALIILAILGVLGIMAILSAQPSTSELPIFFLCLIVPAAVALAFTVGITEAAIAPRVVTKRSAQIHLARAPFGYEPPLDATTAPTFPVRQRFSPVRGRFGAPIGQYSMIIDDQGFSLTRDEFEALIPAIYNVYFLPTLHKIVSVELVSLAEGALQEPSTPAVPQRFDDDSQDVLRA